MARPPASPIGFPFRFSSVNVRLPDATNDSVRALQPTAVMSLPRRSSRDSVHLYAADSCTRGERTGCTGGTLQKWHNPHRLALSWPQRPRSSATTRPTTTHME